MRALVKHPLVDCDVEAAALWYAQRDPEVALRLIEEIRLAMRTAAEAPLRFPVRFGNLRRIRVNHFPHSVYFVATDATVFVVAVLHGARELESLLSSRVASPA